MRVSVSPNKSTNKVSNRGFTLVELLISVAIFVVMTTLLIAKYGNFNQSVLLTDLAYDVALVVRTAQTYGLSVANVTGGPNAQFQYPYGVDFSTVTQGVGDADSSNPSSKRVILFADVDSNGIYKSVSNGGLDLAQNTYNITRSATVTTLCVGMDSNTCNTSVSQLDVSFKRPDPTAIICGNLSCPSTPWQYAKVTITGTDSSTRSLEMYRNGQVSVLK